MSAKKWIPMFCAAVALALAVLIGFNVLVDPFGVFGDPILHWYSYTETNNPRTAKPVYLEQHRGEYDSFIIGSSSAAFYPVEALNEAMDARFYNLFVYGSDTQDYRDLANYVIREFEVKNIILNLGINETNVWDAETDSLTATQHCHVTGRSPFGFYRQFLLGNPKYAAEKLVSRFRDTELPQAFDVFVPETGSYDKRLRDIEKIGDPAVYQAAHGDDFGPCESAMTYWQECVDTVAYIKQLCDANGVTLTVVCSPVYESQWAACPRDKMTAFKTALAEVTDYWDFSHSSLSYDSRFFYDKTHSRNALGVMAAERMFGGEDCYVPDDFGIHITSDNVSASIEALYSAVPSPEPDPVVPILMYHHLEETGNNGTIISREAFDRQMRLIAENGFHAVSFDQLVDYVYHGTPLPENPVCITMDDGYLSNYEIAYPILRSYGLHATIFPIGVSVGKSTYKDTDHPIYPHFSWEQALEMEQSGVIDIGSHTFDMHQSAELETQSPCRSSACPLEGESEDAFIRAMQNDLEQFRRESEAHGLGTPTVLAYPIGSYTPLTEVLVHESGIPVTLSTVNDRPNVLVRGLPQSLYALCRMSINDTITDEELLCFLRGEWDWPAP